MNRQIRSEHARRKREHTLHMGNGSTITFTDYDPEAGEIVARLERDENAFVRFLVDRIRQDIKDEDVARQEDRAVAAEPRLEASPAAPRFDPNGSAGRLYYINPAKDFVLTPVKETQ